MRRGFFAFLAACLSGLLLAGCSGAGAQGGGTLAAGAIQRDPVNSSEVQFAAPADGATIAIFDTSAGEIRAVLYPAYAPQACDNFIGLANSGFYNGTSFYKVLSGFCVEGGLSTDGASSTIWNGSGFSPETTDALHHYSGALCAAADGTGQCGSAFYFMQTLPQAPADALLQQMQDGGYREDVINAYKAAGGAPYLDYTDTVFGQVYSGMDIVDAIAQSPVDDNGKPTTDVIVNSVTIDTYAG